MADPHYKSIFNDWLNQSLKPVVESSAQDAAALLAQITAGVGK